MTVNFRPSWTNGHICSAPNREAVRFINDDDTSQSYTYAQVDEFSNQSTWSEQIICSSGSNTGIVANWAINSGLKRGDVVALMMDNKPEVIFIFVAFMKIGVTLAMINSHLKGHPLLHSFSVCNPSRFIIGTSSDVTDTSVTNTP